MANLSLKKVNMPEQNPEERNKNFLEVSLGYAEEMAIEEAKRCLQCKHKPCVSGCPVNVQIPGFIELVAKGKFEEAYEKVKETNSLPAICGRVCPQETQCESFCVRGIKGEPVGIGRLERFVADWHMANENDEAKSTQNNVIDEFNTNFDINTTKISKEITKKVAIVGSGPASLSCAGELVKLGYGVTIFEAFHTAGGVLVYGIPEFRLPKDVVKREINLLTKLGVEIKTNMVIGKILTLEELKNEGFDAIFIGSGAGLPSFMGIPGENLNGVYSSNEFLTRINLMKAYLFPNCDTPIHVGKNVAVVGGGNVAMDAARSAKRLGAENVYLIYRRSESEMPARLEEVHHAKDEGIIFKLLSNPTKILGTEDGWVNGIECIEMELGEPDNSGRRSPRVKPNSEYIIDVNNVIIAIGQTPNPLITKASPNLKLTKRGNIEADEETGKTNIEGVFSGGDAVTGAATVILAMGAGKKSARAIDEYLK